MGRRCEEAASTSVRTFATLIGPVGARLHLGVGHYLVPEQAVASRRYFDLLGRYNEAIADPAAKFVGIPKKATGDPAVMRKGARAGRHEKKTR